MDKHSNTNHDISIKINGKERSISTHEETNHVEEQIELENEEFDNQDEAEEFPWILVDEPQKNNVIDFEEKRTKNGKKKSNPAPLLKKSRKIFKIPKVWISLISAIVIGTGFGFVVLSLFTDQDMTNLFKSPNAIPVATQSTTTNGEVQGKEEVNTPTPMADESLVSIEPLTVFIIQGGAFSTVPAAEEFQVALRNKGYAGVLLKDTNPVYLFIGLGLSKERASQVGNLYKENGQEIYVKAYTIDKKRIDKEVAPYLQGATNLFQHLVAYSSAELSSSSFSDNRWEEINKMHKSWVEMDYNHEKASGESRVFFDEVKISYQFLDVYQTTKDESLLWKAQQSLLTALLFYKEISS